MNRTILPRLLAAGLALSGLGIVGCQGSGKASAPAELKTDDDKTLYALGLSMGRSINVFHLSPQELSIVQRGMTDEVLKNKPAVEIEQWGPKINGLARKRMTEWSEKESAKEKEKAKPFLAKTETELGVEKLASGLLYKTVTAGTGESPKATDTVKVHYHGTLIDGTVFDSSRERNQPAEFPLNAVIPCWTEGVQKMKVGEKARLVCPSAIGYGDRGSPPKIPPGATLVFEVELLEIKKPEPPPEGMTMPPGMPGMPGGGGMPPGHPPTGNRPAPAPTAK